MQDQFQKKEKKEKAKTTNLKTRRTGNMVHNRAGIQGQVTTDAPSPRGNELSPPATESGKMQYVHHFNTNILNGATIATQAYAC